MESGHYTRSKARRTSPVSDTPSDIEPDDAAPETDTSGPVRLPVTAAEELGSMALQLAEPPSAPAIVEGEDGGSGSDSSFRAGVSLSAPGGQTDPQFGPTSFTPTELNLCRIRLHISTSQSKSSPTVASPVVRRRTPLLSESARRRPPPGARRRRGHGRRL